MVVCKSHVATFCLGVCVALGLFAMLSNQGIPLSRMMKGQMDMKWGPHPLAISTYRSTKASKLSKNLVDDSTIDKGNGVKELKTSQLERRDILRNIKGHWVRTSANSDIDESHPGELESRNDFSLSGKGSSQLERTDTSMLRHNMEHSIGTPAAYSNIDDESGKGSPQLESTDVLHESPNDFSLSRKASPQLESTDILLESLNDFSLSGKASPQLENTDMLFESPNDFSLSGKGSSQLESTDILFESPNDFSLLGKGSSRLKSTDILHESNNDISQYGKGSPQLESTDILLESNDDFSLSGKGSSQLKSTDILHESNNDISLSGKGSPQLESTDILLESPNEFSLSGKGSSQLESTDILLESPNEFSRSGKGSPQLESTDILLESNDDFSLSGKGSSQLKSTDILHESNNDISLSGKGSPQLESTDILLESPNEFSLSGKASPQLESTDILLESPNDFSLSGKGSPELESTRMLLESPNDFSLSGKGSSQLESTDMLLESHNDFSLSGKGPSQLGEADMLRRNKRQQTSAYYSNIDDESNPGELKSPSDISLSGEGSSGGLVQFTKTSTEERSIQSNVIFNFPGAMNNYANLTQIKGGQPVLDVDHDNTDYTPVHDGRIRLIKNVCKDTGLFTNRTYWGNTQKRILYSKYDNFSYCKVPKSGCTFWTQLFLVLHNYTDDAFRLNRSSIHSTSKSFATPLGKAIVNKYRMILVARDPYSRLYSAFIDKCYLSMFPSSKTIPMERLRNDSYGCNYNTTFQEFLEFVIMSARTGQTLNRHWAPIFSMCAPCYVNQYRLVKQETFSKDVAFILKELNVERNKYKTIIDGLLAHRIETTVKGIVEKVYSVSENKTDLKRCLGSAAPAKRLWNSFKIQGYIDDRMEFPEHRFKTDKDYADADFLSNVVIETINNNPLSSIDSKQQRREALVSAYQSVSKASIDGIKDVYKQDFALFGYDTEPPTM